MKTFKKCASHPATRTAGVLLALGTLILVGCGGGGGHSSKAKPRGKVKINVTWPTSAARVIPTNAQSILVQVKSSGTVVSSGLIVRPSNTVTLSEVPSGNVDVTATALPNADGTGNGLATATVPATVTDGNTTTVDLTMASTIDHIGVTPNPFLVGAGQTGQVNVVGYDANGAIVLIDPSTISFSSSNPAVAAITSTGLVTAGTTDGSVTISIAQSDSGKTLNLPLNVVPSVLVTPNTASIPVHGTQTFTATVVGPTNTGVTWSVQEGASGGSITAGGVYTAPATHGTYHVVATSVADPTRSTVVAVGVGAGNLGVTVH